MNISDAPRKFVSRAGLKLQGALDAFELDVHGLRCADFGCNVGGFTDALLAAGAPSVCAVDTGYGTLAWKLRQDPRVTVMERTNCLHTEAPGAVDLVTIDVAWTPQERVIPAAMRWLGPTGVIVSLLKPHYELAKLQKAKPRSPLDDARAGEVCVEICARLDSLGAKVLAVVKSTLRGKGGNCEFLLLIHKTAELSAGDLQKSDG